jgi:peptide/nickel transport system substrate-binding protein
VKNPLRLCASLTMLALGAALLGMGLTRGEASAVTAKIRDGGTFRVAWLPSWFTSIDPALGGLSLTAALLDPTCLRLMNYPDRNPPAGLRITNEAASRYTISKDGKTYTFTIRRGLRLSNGAALTAQSFARSFVRVLAPSMQSDAAFFLDAVAGADNVREGFLPSGIAVRGNRLVFRLTRPVLDFLARMTTPSFCAVSPKLPIDTEGVAAPIHSGGPYYVSANVPGRRIVLKQNRFYKGTRPHHVDRFVVGLEAASSDEVIERIKRGTADWGVEDERGYFHGGKELRRYGSQFSVAPGLTVGFFWLNGKRGVFRSTALRRAANFAVDRRALVRQWGGELAARPTDQYLPPAIPAFRNVSIYPFRPNLRKAKKLARGRLGSGRAAFYVRDDPRHVAVAQIVTRNLAAIGLDVEIEVFPRGVYFQKLNTPGEPWDIALSGWDPAYFDPFTYLNEMLDSHPGFSPSRLYTRLLAQAARSSGADRNRLYGALDVRLARDLAPLIAAFHNVVPTFVSKRVDPRCIVRRPYLDLTSVCLK